MLASSYKKADVSYHEAIEAWRKNQGDRTLFCLIAFRGIPLDRMPEIYVAWPDEIVPVMRNQSGGKGHGALHLAHVPEGWRLTPERFASLWPSKLSVKLSEAA